MQKIANSWMLWIFLVILVRLLIELLSGQVKPSSPTIPIEPLLHFALTTPETTTKKLAFQTLYCLAENSPAHKEEVSKLLRQKFPDTATRLPEITDLLVRLEPKTEDVLRRVINSVSAPLPKQLVSLSFWFSLTTALFLVLVIPCLCMLLAGQPALTKIFGAHAPYKICLLNLLLYSTLAGGWHSLGEQNLLFWHILAILVALLGFHYMVRSGFCSTVLGLLPKASRTTWLTAVVVGGLLLTPYMYLSSVAQKEKIPAERLLHAIESTVSLQERAHLSLLLVILHTPAIYADLQSDAKVKRHILQAMGELGDAGHLPALTQFFLSSPEASLQKETLQAICKIGQRMGHR